MFPLPGLSDHSHGVSVRLFIGSDKVDPASVVPPKGLLEADKQFVEVTHADLLDKSQVFLGQGRRELDTAVLQDAQRQARDHSLGKVGFPRTGRETDELFGVVDFCNSFVEVNLALALSEESLNERRVASLGQIL